MNEERSLALLTEAGKALALAGTVPELKELRDEFSALRAYVRSRGLGIEAENKVAEYILRTERKAGEKLVHMDLHPGGVGIHERGVSGSKPLGPRNGPSGVLGELGLSKNQSSEWQTVARITDDEFEALLRHSKAARKRIAKINFYRTSHKRRGNGSPETAPDKGFAMFRAGAYHLLGWRVGDDGIGAPTKNGLLMLPRDELASFAEIIKLLVAAYTEARAGRQ